MADYFQIFPIILGFIAIILSVFFYRKSKNDSKIEILTLIRSIISFNSQEISQFHFLALELHNELKSEMVMAGSNEKNIAASTKKLTNYLASNIQKIANYNFRYLNQYFESRNKVIPRISLSLFASDDNMKVIARNLDTEISDNLHSINQNTDFSYVVSRGTYFLCNNVVGAKKKHEFLKSDNFSFKSSVAIPLVLTNNSLDESFSKMFSINQIERTIFGILTVDHPQKNYFIEEDVGVLFIVSEMLTNFLVVYNMFTEFSETYNKAIELVGHETSELGFRPTVLHAQTSKPLNKTMKKSS